MTQSTTVVQEDVPWRWGRGRRLGMVTFLAVAALAATFWVGAEWGSRTQSTTAYCLSAPGQIGCTENPDGTGRGYSIPRDVPWSDDGATVQDGRPTCLPPIGIGNIRVTFAYETVEVDGVRRDVAVWVDCTSAQPMR